MRKASRISLLALAALVILASFSAVATAVAQDEPLPAAATPAFNAAPIAASAAPAPPPISAKAAVIMNADDGHVLFSQNPDEHLEMASTTKMMTALLTVENHKKDMNAIVTCSQKCAEVGESSIWLTAGEKLTVREMLVGLLVQSGNDSAMALAEFDAGSEEAFVAKMNKRAQEQGLTNTNFVNPHGLHAPGHYTSAADFAKLGREIMKYPEIRDIVKMTDANISWAGHPEGRQLQTHNHLLALDSDVNGVKTGFTDEAGQCIVISASQNGTNLIISYLGGSSLSQRDSDILNMLQFGFSYYVQKTLISGGTEYATVDLPYNLDHKLSLTSDGDLTKKVLVTDSVERKLVLPDKLNLPIHKGDKMGLVEAYEGNKYLGSTYLLAASDVSPPSFKDKIGYYVEAAYSFLLSAVRR